MPCPLCDLVSQAGQTGHFRLIHEFEHSFLMVGEHQLFEGYCVLVLKEHHRELHELPEPLQSGFHSELIQSARAISKAFHPWKMNLSSYGNQVPHLHWHLFPRTQSDPLKLQTPWAQQDQYAAHKTSEAQARAVAQALRPHI